MKESLRFRNLLAFCVLVLCGLPGIYFQFSVSASSAKYSQDAKGLEKQYELFLAAYAKHDSAAMDQAFTVFALPQPERWFGAYFAEQDLDQVVKENELDLVTYKKSLPNMMKQLSEGHRYHAHVERLKPLSKIDLLPRPDPLLPIAAVPIEQYSITLEAVTGNTGISFAEMANFVYVDGSYRYLGTGPYPFWSAPDLPRRKK
jgi:hypothetical protein